MPPVGLFYELDFRVKGVDFSAGGDIFTVYLGDAANEAIKNAIPRISFSQEKNGKAYIMLYDSVKEIGRSMEFNGRWHNIQVLMDNANDQISVYLDGKLLLENVPRDSMAYFSAAISFSVGPNHSADVDIDDVSVSAFYSLEDKNQWIRLFSEDFERFNMENGLDKYE